MADRSTWRWPRARRIATVVALLSLLAAGCGDDGEPSDAAAIARVARWSQFAATLERAVTEANPFDAQQVAVYGEFRSPTGALHEAVGFVTREYQRRLNNGSEQLSALGDRRWQVRFTPAEEGRWTWRWRIEAAGRIEYGVWTDLDVGAAQPDSHGFVRRSQRDARYLELDDGGPLWLVGENLAWYDERGTFAYDQWIARLAAQGCNYIRLWMPSWAFGLERIRRASDGSVASSTLGNYTDSLDRASQLDYVIELARRHGMYVMLAIQNHGPFSLTSNSEWSDNPYNAANGGPLQTPSEFFSNAEAKALFKRRLRYLVARWGDAPNLLAWELWNEVDLTEQPAREVLLDWHREMAAEIRVLDPYDHLITTSTSAQRGLEIWNLPEIDLVQLHVYSFGGLPFDFSNLLPNLVLRLRAPGKPVLIAEAGVDFAGPAQTIEHDPNADGFHDILWSGLIAQTFGTGMTWWWDNVIDPQNLYFHFGPVRQLTRGIDFAAEVFESRTLPTGDVDVSAFVLQGQRTVLAWIKNTRHQWYAPDPSTLRDASFELNDLAAGTWSGSWIDTRTGVSTPTGSLTAMDGLPLQLHAPEFERDIALRLEWQP